ncbi:flagellar hook-basal body protein [Gimesia panareensis]|uniref:Flagellar basal-body rod protein FlgG n=1 Tax=Gimesia panareensis TaxID=2527978 RepID=A0A517Q1X7_9PLAN|nr:flagellar hook-basal body protein [Gimesia panareensis]QDT25625.1 Flagellar basal-body rod protein FlgG [Gimesia panareensis]QDU48571.1 Flagellar basal-body rod protein FlgG [Gimesia panareensis]
MIYGMYLSAQGADANSVRMDVLANNMANANTTSFKRDIPIFRINPPADEKQAPLAPLPGDLENHSGGISLEGMTTNFENGAFTSTGSDFDLALKGQGFFQVGSAQKSYLTRNGSLSLDSKRRIVTADQGLPLLTRNGQEITLPTDAVRMEVSPDGLVTPFDAEGQALGSLGPIAVVMPNSLNELVKQGNSLYTSEGRVSDAAGPVSIQQGFLEASGTNSIEEMMELVTSTRMFESNINMIKLQDDSLGRLLQSMPRR